MRTSGSILTDLHIRLIAIQVKFLLVLNHLLRVFLPGDVNLTVDMFKQLLKIFDLELRLRNLRSIPHFEQKLLFVDQKVLYIVWVKFVDDILNEILHTGVFDSIRKVQSVCTSNLYIFVQSELKEHTENKSEKQERNDPNSEHDD